MDRPTPPWQQRSHCDSVEASHWSRSPESDATVPADYALMMTTTIFFIRGIVYMNSYVFTPQQTRQLPKKFHTKASKFRSWYNETNTDRYLDKQLKILLLICAVLPRETLRDVGQYFWLLNPTPVNICIMTYTPAIDILMLTIVHIEAFCTWDLLYCTYVISNAERFSSKWH